MAVSAGACWCWLSAAGKLTAVESSCRPRALLGLLLYLFLVTVCFWGHLTTGFENNIDRGWLHTNTKQIPQLTGSRYTLSADGFTSCKTCRCVNHSLSQGCLLFPEHLTQGGSGRLYLRRASLNVANHHLKASATKAASNRSVLLCDPIVKQKQKKK